MTLLTKGADRVIALVWHCVDAITRKSPLSMAGVMEKPVFPPGFDRLIVVCSPQKIEQLILDDRSANRTAELILLQAVAHQRCGAPAVEEVVAGVFEEIAVDRIGPDFAWRR